MEMSFSVYYDYDCFGSVDCCMNMTYLEASEQLLYSQNAAIITKYILPILLVIGVVDNTAFIYVVAKQSSMKTATNVYLVNLAVSDIVFLLSGILAKVWAFAKSPFLIDDNPLGPVGCIFVPFLIDAAYFSSLVFVSLVSFEIFMAVCHPKRQSVVRHRLCSMWIATLAWTASCVIAALIIPSNSGLRDLCFDLEDTELTRSWPTSLGICGVEVEWLSVLAHLIQTVPFFVTFYFNVFMYVKIVIALHRSMGRLQEHAPAKRDTDAHLRNQIARMLVVNGAVFFVLLVPFEILSFLKAFGFDPKVERIAAVSLVIRGLTYLNSVINPVIYIAMSKRYREAFVNVLSKHTRRCRPLHSPADGTAGHQSTQNYIRVTQVTSRM